MSLRRPTGRSTSCACRRYVEDVAILNLETRLEQMHVETKEMTDNYLTTTRLANSGDPNAKDKLQSCARMTEHELSLKSLSRSCAC